MKKAVLYIRNASGSQQGQEILDEASRLQDCAKNIGCTITDIYLDICSSREPINKRDLGRLLKDAACGKFDVVVMRDASRISRQYGDVEAFIKELSKCKTKLIMA